MQRKRIATLLLSAVSTTALLVTAGSSMARDGQAFDPSRSDVIFNNVKPGQTSDAQTVTVRNSSAGPIHYDALRLVGPHPNDFVFSDDCAGRTLGANEACEVKIRFRPTTDGTRVAHLRFDSDSDACSNWITLAGGGATQPSAKASACDKRPEPAPAPAAAPATVAPSSSPAISNTAISLPARSCRSRRAFKIHVNPPRGIRFTKVTVRLNTRIVRVVRGRNITADVSLRGLPRGRFALHVTARTASGRTLQRDRHYVTCVKDRSS